MESADDLDPRVCPSCRRWTLRAEGPQRLTCSSCGQVVEGTLRFQVVREGDGHVMSEHLTEAAAAEEAAARTDLAHLWEREPATYRVIAVRRGVR